MTDLRILSPDAWSELAEAHVQRAQHLTAEHQKRRARGERHPVWDFMFSYYPVTPGKLAKWHPGYGVGLELRSNHDGSDDQWLSHHHKYYHGNNGVLSLDLPAYLQARGETVRFIRRLLAATSERPARFDCFGLHEWAMVYRDDPRHPEPLRLGRAATNQVVEESHLRCTHFDAFRFFTPKAKPLNAQHLEREGQVATEQPGCIHASMDLYKWATKLGPLIPGELWLDTFEHACALRKFDMQASPYNLSEWGFTPIKIESPEGRAEYARGQKKLAERGQGLRSRLLDHIDRALNEPNPMR